MVNSAEDHTPAEAVAQAESEQPREDRETAPESATRFGEHRFEVAERASELVGQGQEHYVEMKSDRRTLARFEKDFDSGALERQCADPETAANARAALDALRPHLRGAQEQIADKSEVYRSVGLDPDQELRGERLSWREQRRFKRAEKRGQAYEEARDNRNVLFGEFAEEADDLGGKEYKQLKKKLLQADDRLTRTGEKFTGQAATPAERFEVAAYEPARLDADLQQRLADEYAVTPREGEWAQRKQAKRQAVLEREVGGVLQGEHRGKELDRGFELAKDEGDAKGLVWAHESRQANRQELSRARNRAGNAHERTQRAGKIYEMIYRLHDRGVDTAIAGIEAAHKTWVQKADGAEATAEERSEATAAEAAQTTAGAKELTDRLATLEQEVAEIRGRLGQVEGKQANTAEQVTQITELATKFGISPEEAKEVAVGAEAVRQGASDAAEAIQEQADVTGSKLPETPAAAPAGKPAGELGPEETPKPTVESGAAAPGGESRQEAPAQPEATPGAAERERGDRDKQLNLLREIGKYKANIDRDLFGGLHALPLDQLGRVAKAAEADADMRKKEPGSESAFDRVTFQDATGHEWARDKYGINTFIQERLRAQTSESVTTGSRTA